MFLFLAYLLQITLPWPIYSTEADTHFPKITKVKFLFFRQFHDLGRAFPEWAPVSGKNYWMPLEGIVATQKSLDDPKPQGCHVSTEDFPLTHYTHDLTTNVQPFPTPDNRNTNLLANKVLLTKSDKELSKYWRAIYPHQAALRTPKILKNPRKVAYHRSKLEKLNQELSTIWGDTIKSNAIHTEWETGLGAANPGNICSEKNKIGESCGFASAGHQRGDHIWNWSSMGDWTHLEGLWIWDRGHPPAGAELHPLSWMVFSRHNPELVFKTKPQADPQLSATEIFDRKRSLQHLLAQTPSETQLYADIVEQIAEVQKIWINLRQHHTTTHWATRIDLFGSGDGGALYNNRPNMPRFVQKVPIHNRDYEFVAPLLQKVINPHHFVCSFQKQPGNTFVAEPTWELVDNDSVRIKVPWKTTHQPDTAVFAQSCLCYENNTNPENNKIKSFRITLDTLIIRGVPESGKGELRMYAAIGNKYLMLNEFVPVQNILQDGLGQTKQGTYPIGQTVEVHLLPEDSVWIHAIGWDADGIDKVFGHIFDPNAPFDEILLQNFKEVILDPLRVGLGGCKDDPMGEINQYFTAKELSERKVLTLRSEIVPYDDPCPIGGKQRYEGLFELVFHIDLSNSNDAETWGTRAP